MPHVTFIYPAIGHLPGHQYVRSWQMEPLGIGVLAGLTPPEWDQSFFDDRLERIDYGRKTDLVAISIETFSARRGYQIAARYRGMGVPVVMGGYHATFCPREVLEYADAVCVGDAEDAWPAILRDTRAGRLAGIYARPLQGTLDTRVDRSIYRGKRYFKLALMETSRGCPYNCSFCSISAFHRRQCKHRPLSQVVSDLRQCGHKRVFFVDDNLINDAQRARDLFLALKPLGLRWIGQASIDATRDPELLDLMVQSGCVGLLIGFETMQPDSLRCIQKGVNHGVDYAQALGRLRRRGIVVYGTFLLGLPGEHADSAAMDVSFAQREKLFIAAFNHVIPFPGTRLYRQFAQEGRLMYPKWWLSGEYRFGDAPFHPDGACAKELSDRCHAARKRFYSFSSIFSRALDWRANCRPLRNLVFFFGINLMLRKDIRERRGLPLGNENWQEETTHAPCIN